MLTALEDHQFELLPSEDSEDGVPFGIGLPVSVDAGGFDPGSREWLVQDQQDPYTGAVRTGRDVLGPSPWTWSLHVNRLDEEGALDSLSELGDAWLGAATDPNKTSILRYKVGGRTRRVFGRPRRWSNPPDNRILSGLVPVTADFQRVDALHYDDQIQSVELDLVYESAGGFVFPVVFPVLTMPGGFSPGEAFVGGTQQTYPIIRVNGPVTNPEVSTPDWTLKLTTTISAGNWIEIDTRPWKRTVLRNDGASVAGILGTRTRLRDLILKPGHQSFNFRGLSAEGTGSATLKWYAAYSSL